MIVSEELIEPYARQVKSVYSYKIIRRGNAKEMINLKK
jgi:hypothetical protein